MDANADKEMCFLWSCGCRTVYERMSRRKHREYKISDTNYFLLRGLHIFKELYTASFRKKLYKYENVRIFNLSAFVFEISQKSKSRRLSVGLL